MEDLVTYAEAEGAELSRLPAAIVLPGRTIRLSADGEIEMLGTDRARDALTDEPHLMVSRAVALRRLGVPFLPAYDLLELFAFARPARFCLPTLQGLYEALTLGSMPEDPVDQCLGLPEVAARLLSDLGSETYRYRAGSGRVAHFMARAGWAWGPFVVKALSALRDDSREDGLKVWTALNEWEDDAPPRRPGDESIDQSEAEDRLSLVLGDGAEVREGQTRYARAATHIFKPRELADMPNLQILEAGTGTGKTLGYIAPASLWAERNDGPVWLSTYTKNLQRQLDQELTKLYPRPRDKAKKAVIRKGRENYACLLNIEETLRAVETRPAQTGGEDRDRILMGLVTRWARFSRDGDMVGGDFPSWLGATFGQGRISGLTDRRGECLHAGCAHYRKCFIERASRASKHADLVVANHALLLSQAVMRQGDPDLPLRIVFDEGHHLFDAADSVFALRLSGLEGAELRRWLRGKESGGSTRARGLKSRLEELIQDDTEAKQYLDAVLDAATRLPGEGWTARVMNNAHQTAFEKLLSHVRQHIFARTDADGPYSLEAALNEPLPDFKDAAAELVLQLKTLTSPMTQLAKRLMTLLNEDADILDSGARGRLEAAARSLALRADMVAGWRSVLEGLGGEPLEGFFDWAELDRIEGRDRDVALCRNFVDPTKPLGELVLAPAHGVLVTSATLRDKGADPEVPDRETGERDWAAADMRTGATYLPGAARRLSVESPFDYAKRSRFIVVTDVTKQRLEPVAGAFEALFRASGGGALGLFTAVQRLKAVYGALVPRMEDLGLPLYGQHVDPIDVSTLVDIFRAETTSCLLGTDAVRDGVDVPGDSLRLIVFDRVPWPRPTLLHRARRSAFGGRTYDEMLTRLKITQAFGRLVRRKSDRGVFVMLDGQTPSRLLTGLPDGVMVERMGLADCVAEVRSFLNAPDQSLLPSTPSEG